MVATLHVCLVCPMTNRPLVPWNSLICRKNGPKMAKNGLNVRRLCPTSPKPQTRRILGYVAQTWPTRNPPLFVVSNPRNHPARGVDPCTSAHLVEPQGSSARARWGPTVRPIRSPGRNKSFFPKLFLDHLGCSGKCFWPVLRVLAHGKSENVLKISRFGTNNGSKMGQKHVFSNMIMHHLGWPNKFFLA